MCPSLHIMQSPLDGVKIGNNCHKEILLGKRLDLESSLFTFLEAAVLLQFYTFMEYCILRWIGIMSLILRNPIWV